MKTRMIIKFKCPHCSKLNFNRSRVKGISDEGYKEFLRNKEVQAMSSLNFSQPFSLRTDPTRGELRKRIYTCDNHQCQKDFVVYIKIKPEITVFKLEEPN